METVVNVHVSPGKAFVVRCPHCAHAAEFPPAAAGGENPFVSRCQCGRDLRVLMNFRRRIRKTVHLTGAVSFPPAQGTEVCTVDDVSVTGLGLSVYPPSAASVGTHVVVKVVLNDPQSSRLSLPGVVRRVHKAGARVVVGLEFVRLPDYESQALSFYLM